MKNIVTFGELMLRLTPPGKNVLLETRDIVATFGGAEANVAAANSALGNKAVFVTALPDNELGDAAVTELMRAGVDTQFITRTKGRMGLYFTQTGAGVRPSKVLYDRVDSAVSLLKPGDIDWDVVLKDADWFHISGITPALSQSVAQVALEAVKACNKHNITVSCDLNFRNNLWRWGKSAREVMPELVRHVDVLIGNEEDCQKCLGVTLDQDVEAGLLDTAKYQALTAKVLKEYPNIKTVAVSLRESKSADTNGWSGVIRQGSDFFISRKYELSNIVDRIGGGDSFAGGLIYALRNFNDPQKAINFAVAVSALKHTHYGDFLKVGLKDVQNLVAGDTSGRIQR